MSKWAVIVPTIRPEKFKDFLQLWREIFTEHKVHLFVMEDLPDYSESSNLLMNAGFDWTVLCHKDMTTQFIPTRTDMVRSFAIHYAYTHSSTQYMLTLDDDTAPIGDPLAEYEKVFEAGTVLSEYVDIGSFTTSGLQLRGFPYKDRVRVPVAVQYGGWDGVLDYDAATQLAVPRGLETFYDIVFPVPKGAAATCCIMNTAWQTRYTPIMWQLPMLDGRYNRVGDIWSGLFIKKTLDAIGHGMVMNGKAKVLHSRASDPYNSLIKEAASAKINDGLWDNLHVSETGVKEAYNQVITSAANYFAEHDKEYAEHFKKAYDEWINLYE